MDVEVKEASLSGFSVKPFVPIHYFIVLKLFPRVVTNLQAIFDPLL